MAVQYQKSPDPILPFLGLVNAKIWAINTAYPASVLSVGSTTVTVQPEIKSFYADNMGNLQTTDYPPVEVPLMQIGSNAANMQTSVSIGDMGVVIVNQADTDAVYNPSITAPMSNRKFDLVDGTFYPFSQRGANTQTGTIDLNAGTINLNGLSSINLTSTGNITLQGLGFSMTNPSGELIAILIQLFTIIQGLVTTLGDTLNPATQSAIAAQILLLASFTL